MIWTVSSSDELQDIVEKIRSQMEDGQSKLKPIDNGFFKKLKETSKKRGPSSTAESSKKFQKMVRVY